MTPNAIETQNVSRKMPTPWKNDRTWIVSPWNCDSVLRAREDPGQFPVPFLLCQPARSSLLEHDNSHCIVENTLAENDRVELGVDVKRVEDSEDGYGVGGGEGGAEEEALDDGEREAFESEEGVDVDDEAGERVGE